MKILQINNNFEKVGGSDTVFCNTIELLRNRGHDVITLSRIHQAEKVSSRNDYFIEQSSALFKRFYSRDAKEKIELILKKEKPELVHIHCIIGGVTFSILPVIKKYKIPVVITIHDFRLKCPVGIHLNRKGQICEKCKTGQYYHCILDNCSSEGLFRSVNITIESYFRDIFIPYYKYVDTFVFVSNFVHDKFIETNKKLEKKSTVIHNFTKNYYKSETFGNYFLYFGRLVREKGLITLLDAFKELPELNLKIAGDGPLKKIIEAKKTENVELVGFKTGKELEELIQNSSFIIVPSECFETLSLSTVEAFAMGKPVIGSKLGALTELIKENERGYKFEPGNSEHLKKIILKSSKLSVEDYKNISESAFTYANSRFIEDVYYNKLAKVYKNVLSKQKTR